MVRNESATCYQQGRYIEKEKNRLLFSRFNLVTNFKIK